MNACSRFDPWQPLIEGKAHSICRALAIVPARNEEASIAKTLDALAGQTDLNGDLLDPVSFEVLLLLNNCTDRTADKARLWAMDHPRTALHIVERQFGGDSAHVGTARRWLMDTAWHRLDGRRQHPKSSGILSTDSDTIVQSDWIAQNLRALEDGADAVGGVIALKEGELAKLSNAARDAYCHDRTYQDLVARLEDMLDPQDGDPWPRHLEHFGASLACTPEAYAKAGGMPDVQPLEDVAFVDRLRRQGARIRHAPEVRVFTSARLDGRAQVGLSFQLREWERLSEGNEEHLVLSASWLIHRFQMMAKLRHFYRSQEPVIRLNPEQARTDEMLAARDRSESLEDFLVEIDCDRIIEDSFRLQKEQPISVANKDLSHAIRLRSIETR